MKLEQLENSYQNRKHEIEERLLELDKIKHYDKKRVFKELAFCLSVAQSKAVYCWDAINEMEKDGSLWNGSKEDILKHMNKVRFSDNKSTNIILARELFFSDENIMKNLKGDPKEIREWVINNIRGLGYKGATHFLRNIGIYQHLAILDVHILVKLKEFGVIDEIPKTLTPKKYLETEKKMEEFSEKIGIPMDHLDLLLWSERTGYVFK